MNTDEFYAECAALLDTSDDCVGFPYHRRTRWNNRKPGRGRFPGFGIIRDFGDVVHINLHSPIRIEKVITGRKEALDFLRDQVTSLVD